MLSHYTKQKKNHEKNFKKKWKKYVFFLFFVCVYIYLIASNTSSIPITRIAGFIKERSSNVIGMHFMNPVPVMKLVEIIPALSSHNDTINTTIELAELMGKTTSVSKDEAGFIANRILMPYINEAAFCLQV